MRCELCGGDNAVTQTVRITEGVYKTVTLCENRVECWQRWDERYLNKTNGRGKCIHGYLKLIGDESYAYCNIIDRMVEGGERDSCPHYQTKS